jgi:hypothetical protein
MAFLWPKSKLLGDELCEIADDSNGKIKAYSNYLDKELMHRFTVCAKEAARTGAHTLQLDVVGIVTSIHATTTHLAQDLIPAINWDEFHDHNRKVLDAQKISYTVIGNNQAVIIGWPSEKKPLIEVISVPVKTTSNV